MKCSEIINELEQLSPVQYASSWDNIGLLAGRRDKEVKTVFLALDATDEIIEEAIEKKADMLITHHPLIFSPLKKINTDDFIGRRVVRLIQHDISYYAMHTNFDVSTMAGLSADYIGLEKQKILKTSYKPDYEKIVVFVPVQQAGIVREAILEAGGGFIGNYSHCSFNSKGTGTFKPLEGTHPFIGETGTFEQVEEIKIETIVLKEKTPIVIEKMLKVHPYEEPAYDIYPLKNKGEEAGLGRIGTLPKEMPLSKCAELVKERFHIESVKVFGNLDALVKKAAISPGSGKSVILPSIQEGAQVLITGDIDHHDGIDAVARGLSIIDGGHYGIESIFISFMKKYLIKTYPQLSVEAEQIKNPFQIL